MAGVGVLINRYSNRYSDKYINMYVIECFLLGPKLLQFCVEFIGAKLFYASLYNCNSYLILNDSNS